MVEKALAGTAVVYAGHIKPAVGSCRVAFPQLVNAEKTDNKQLLDEVKHDIMNYQNQGLCYLPQPSASADNTDTRF